MLNHLDQLKKLTEFLLAFGQRLGKQLQFLANAGQRIGVIKR